MNQEAIIRVEADEFINWEKDLVISETMMICKDIKERLLDFYSPQSKSIFLDQLKVNLLNELKEHRDIRHEGVADHSCDYDLKAEKLLFYINQELEILPLFAKQKSNVIINEKRNKVFLSYSNKDKVYLEDIKRHFKPFEDEIDFWDDSKIVPGQKWKMEIQNAINQTKVGILLLSADFLASNFIKNEELPNLLKVAEKEGAVILIVILKPCLIEAFDDLSQFQALNSPDNPIVKMSIVEREELYVNLLRQTKRILSEL